MGHFIGEFQVFRSLSLTTRMLCEGIQKENHSIWLKKKILFFSVLISYEYLIRLMIQTS